MDLDIKLSKKIVTPEIVGSRSFFFLTIETRYFQLKQEEVFSQNG